MIGKSSEAEVEALRDEISHTRQELGETVHALAARADMGSRARDTARRTATRMRTAGAAPELLVAYAAGAAALVLWVIARRRAASGRTRRLRRMS